MLEEKKPESHPVHVALERAVNVWAANGEVRLLEAWLGKELDEDGIPVRLPVPEWWECLRGLVRARSARKSWPRRLDSRLLALSRSLLRFARPDGTSTLGPVDAAAVMEAKALLQEILTLYPRSRESRVISWTLGRPESNHNPPPLPAWHSRQQVLAALRADWRKKGDSLVIDQRRRSPVAGLELIGAGVRWLGPSWRLLQACEAGGPGKSVVSRSDSVADLAEWTYRASGLRLVRTALVLRSRRMALLGEQVSSPKGALPPLEARFSLATGVRGEAMEGIRGVRLIADGNRADAQVLPLGLPALPYETERGSFQVSPDDPSLCLKTAAKGRRCWLPVLMSWDPGRHRKRLSWRQLTVSEDGRVCPPDTAFAARVSWGREDTTVIYRSLGPPAHRAFLGHQTTARFLIGRFTSDGLVEPLVSIDE